MLSILALRAGLSPALLPPALQAEFDGIVDLLIVETVFPTLLVPIAVCLFMFTKPEIQRKPVFILNVLSIMLGLVFGGIAIATVSRSVSGRLVSPEFITALTGLYFFIPVCVQCILFVRIHAVYPPRTISRALFVAIYGTLGAMTLARIANISVALKRISDASRLSPDPWAVTTVGRHVPSVTAELSMALVYDTIASSLFLFRLHQGGALKSNSADHHIVSRGEGRMSYTARLRALFWIALTNFVLPVIFNVILLILAQQETFSNIVTVIAVISVNVYVQIVSGILATLWCHAGSYPQTSSAPARESPVIESISTIKFAPPTRSVLSSHIHMELNTGHASSATESSGSDREEGA